MPKGKIKWLNRQIGAGFIRTEEGENVFFPFSALETGDRKIIKEGQWVRFRLMENRRGITLSAYNVQAIECSQAVESRTSS